MVTWDSQDGLASTIIGMLSSGISGYSLTHSDIGGYTSLHVSILKYVTTHKFGIYCAHPLACVCVHIELQLHVHVLEKNLVSPL